MKWTQWLPLVQLLLALEGCLSEVVASSKLPDIYWNASNPIFRIDNTDHIIDVNRGNNAFEYDQVNLICPSYPRKEGTATDSESYIIYNVSKEEYDSCIITNSNARIIAVCDRPHSAARYFTITFRSFTPQPGGLEFRPGQDYYFISTSTGTPEGLHNRRGGSCASSHMKVTFKVCCAARDASQLSKPVNASVAATHLPRHRHHASNASTTASPTVVSLESRARQLPPLLPADSPTPRSPSGPLKPASSSMTSAVASDQRSRYSPFNRLPATTSHSVTTSASTPFWWRPQYPKGGSPGRQDGREDAMSGDSGTGGGGSERATRRAGRAWLLVVAAGIAVGVACLIVCGLGVGRRLFVREKHKETVIHSYPRIHV